MKFPLDLGIFIVIMHENVRIKLSNATNFYENINILADLVG